MVVKLKVDDDSLSSAKGERQKELGKRFGRLVFKFYHLNTRPARGRDRDQTQALPVRENDSTVTARGTGSSQSLRHRALSETALKGKALDYRVAYVSQPLLHIHTSLTNARYNQF